MSWMSGPFYVASIVECLGTKTLVADEMAAASPGKQLVTQASRRTPSPWL